ncbi:MAG: hypothetical protein ACC641_08300 [Acidiferrobacterales bacterium]
MRLLEPDVTLTDFALAVECALFVVLLSVTSRWGLPYQTAFVFFFACNSLASFFGGLVHGYYPDRHRGPGAWFWRGSLLTLGASTIAVWAIGSQLLFSPDVTKFITAGAIGAFLIYAYFLVTRFPPFFWAVLFYLPAVFFLLAAFVITYSRSGEQAMLFGLIGALLTLLAAIIQRLKIGLHPRHFNHNALYHVVQAIAFLMIFLAARQMILY